MIQPVRHLARTYVHTCVTRVHHLWGWLQIRNDEMRPQERGYYTTYHNTYEQLKGNKRKGIAPLAWDIPDEHDPEDLGSAFEVANSGGVPLGVLYRDESRLPFEARIEEIGRSAKSKTVEQMIEAYAV